MQNFVRIDHADRLDVVPKYFPMWDHSNTEWTFASVPVVLAADPIDIGTGAVCNLHGKGRTGYYTKTEIPYMRTADHRYRHDFQRRDKYCDQDLHAIHSSLKSLQIL